MSLLRANRAQYTDVSLHGVVDVDTVEVDLPSIQGTAEMEGRNLFLFITENDCILKLVAQPWMHFKH